ncbi:glycosyltransferase family 4 protein [Plantibacter cousiniae (nom. nud.)]|uniref:glycosyltransferase family 4 protein n=1 Tax=Plantibacter cousiniae (nom. nud.) TaxID=199709 RepID=UPI001E012FF7|nr:glycosyltransferase family 1 protein [Plantibacter cousiniae]CAH0256198.1 D-inositol 3-phosphate glycosyltransferase [Plantibacter cousiniae]
MILADTRWSGVHGIGRYASEVLPRLSVEWSALEVGGRPSQPQDFLRVRRAPRGASIYSPGYNGFIARIPQVVTIHDLIHLHPTTPRRSVYAAHYATVLRPLVRRNRLVLTVSETSKRVIEEWVNDDRVRVVNAGNGLSAAFRIHGPSEAAGPYFLYVGNLRAHKNLDVVLKALAQTDDCRLVVVMNDRDGAIRRAAEFGVAERVDVRSGLTDDALAALYRGAVATVFPSLVEGFGLPAAESIACGTPVIFWEGCESIAEISRGQGVSIADAHDDLEWARALSATLADRPQASEFAAEYSWDKTADLVSTTLRER